MARRRNVSSTLYLGTRMQAGCRTGHAWLRVGDDLVVGKENRAGYDVIAAFRKNDMTAKRTSRPTAQFRFLAACFCVPQTEERYDRQKLQF